MDMRALKAIGSIVDTIGDITSTPDFNKRLKELLETNADIERNSAKINDQLVKLTATQIDVESKLANYSKLEDVIERRDQKSKQALKEANAAKKESDEALGEARRTFNNATREHAEIKTQYAQLNKDRETMLIELRRKTDAVKLREGAVTEREERIRKAVS